MKARERLVRDLMEVGLEEIARRAGRGEFAGRPALRSTLAALLAEIGNDGALQIRTSILAGAYDEDSDAQEEAL